LASVALGCNVVEKHIKLDNESESVDSFFSLTVEEFAMMVRELKHAWQALGSVSYELTTESAKNRKGTRSLYVCKAIRQGEIFTEENIKSVRPGYGLHTKYKPEILGKKARKELKLGDRLSWDVIE